jgi:hypothetical protein
MGAGDRAGRQREGIAKAKAAGKYKGRPVSIDVVQIKQLRATLGPRRSRSASALPGAAFIACWVQHSLMRRTGPSTETVPSRMVGKARGE